MENEYMRLKFSFTPIVLVVIIKNEENNYAGEFTKRVIKEKGHTFKIRWLSEGYLLKECPLI